MAAKIAIIFQIAPKNSKKITSIGSGAFIDCSGLTSVTIPNTVTSIGSGAFSRCSGLTSVTIPNSVTSIGSGAFDGCSGLTSVTIPNSVTEIGDKAFSGCSGLTKAEFASVESLCNIKFVYLYSNPLYYAHHLYINGEEVKDLVIPNSVTSIGGFAFYNCSGLTSVTIPNSVTSIGEGAFKGCSGLTRAEFASVESLCNIKFSNSASNPLSYAHKLCIDGKEVTDLVIPNSVTSIGRSAFSGCSGLTSVTIPNSVTSIGSYAFYGCSSLSSVTIPENLTSISSSVFDGCDACSIYVKKGTAILLRLWNAGYMTYDITTHERLVAPGVEIQDSTASALKCGLNNP